MSETAGYVRTNDDQLNLVYFLLSAMRADLI